MNRLFQVLAFCLLLVAPALQAALIDIKFSGVVSGIILSPSTVIFNDFEVGDSVDVTLEYDPNTPFDAGLGSFAGAITAANLAIEEGEADAFNADITFVSSSASVFQNAIDSFGASIFNIINAPVFDGLFLNSISIVVQDLDGVTLSSADLPSSVDPLIALLNASNGQSFFSLSFNNGGSIPTEFATLQIALSSITDVTPTTGGPGPVAAPEPGSLALLMMGLLGFYGIGKRRKSLSSISLA